MGNNLTIPIMSKLKDAEGPLAAAISRLQLLPFAPFVSEHVTVRSFKVSRFAVRNFRIPEFRNSTASFAHPMSIQPAIHARIIFYRARNARAHTFCNSA